MKVKIEKGFTLIEVLTATVILGILGAGLLGLQYILSQNQVVVWTSYLAVEDANLSLTALEKELRNTRSSENGAYPLVETQDQEIILYSDYDFDGQVERVRYTLAGTDFIKGVIEPTGAPATYPLADERVKTLTNNVRNGASPVFYYYNSDWPTDTTGNPLVLADRISNTRLVKVVLRLNTKADEPSSDYVLESNVELRTLKDNF